MGDGIRRMLKTIGDNSLWGYYSYKGRKGKLQFQQLLINDVIIRKFQNLPLMTNNQYFKISNYLDCKEIVNKIW